MKKILLLGAVALFGAMNAQTEKGSWVIGGSTTLGFNNVTTKTKANGESYDGPKISTFSFTPSVGYFVANKIAIGLDLGFQSTTTKDEGDKLTSSTILVMPTATYYFKSDSKVIPYLGAGVGYGSNTSKYNSSESNTTDGLTWGAKGGITYMVNQSAGIDLGLAYTQFSNKEEIMGYEVKNNANTFGVNVGFSFFFK